MKKTAYILCILASLVLVFSGCSDGREGPAEKESAGKTNDGHDLVVFGRGDLDEMLFKIDTVYITDSSFLGRLYFRNLPESKMPEPGDIINSSITKVTPYGFLYRATDVSKESDGITVVSVAYASLAEAVEEADVEFEVPLVYDEDDGQGKQILAKSIFGRIASAVVKVVNTVVDALAGNWDVGGTKGQTFSVNKGTSFGNSNNSNVTLNGSYTLALTARIKLKNYSLDYAKMSVSQNKYLNLEGNLRGSISQKKDYELASFRLPDIEFMVGPVYVYIQNTAVIKAKVEAEAQVNMSAKLIFNEFSEYGFEYNGSFKKISTCDKDFYYDYKHSAFGSIRLGVLVGFNSLFYGVAGLELSAGPSLELKSPMLPLTASSKTTLNKDLDIDAKVKLQFLDFLKKEYSFGSVRASLGTLSSSKTLPSFDFKKTDFDLKGIASGRLSFPFKISKPELGFSVEESGFCIEPKEGECIKGFGFGLGKLGKVEKTGNLLKQSFSIIFENLTPGTYNIIPYFKSLDGEIYYDMANALMNFAIDSYCGAATFNPKTQFCSLQTISVHDLCGGKDYNTLTQFCFANAVYEKCGGGTYIPSAQFCSGNALYDLCNGNSYNPSAQFCYSRMAYGLCNGNTYNPSTHFCSGNVLYDLCGGSSYNPSTHFCFNRTAYPKCGGKVYDPLEEGCCGTAIFNFHMQECSSNGQIADKDFVYGESGYSYGQKKIGEQMWLTNNLNENVPGSRCYDDNPINCRIYGRLYDWATAMALPDSCNTHSCSSQISAKHRGICPSGFHIPTLAEWNKLVLFAEGKDGPDADYNSHSYYNIANVKLIAKSPLWTSTAYFTSGGTDEFGFSIMPGGHCSGNSCSFIQGVSFFWGATEGGDRYENDYGSYDDPDYHMKYSHANFAVFKATYAWGGVGYGIWKTDAYSIRCVKD